MNDRTLPDKPILPLPLRAFLALSIVAMAVVAFAACSPARRCNPATSGATTVVNVFGAKADACTPCAPAKPAAAVAQEPRAAAPDACPGGICTVPTPFHAVAWGPEGAVGAIGAAGPDLPVPVQRQDRSAGSLPWTLWAACGLVVVAVLLGLRRASRLGAALGVAALALALLPGCRVMGALGESLPASEGYVDELHAAQDQALAKLREHVDKADEKIRADAIQSRKDGEAAFGQAIAEGKTIPQAVVVQIMAEVNVAKSAADDAKASAQRAGQDASASAASAVERAKAVAQEEAGGGTPWWASLLGLLTGGGTLALFLRRLLNAYDAKPFEGPGGAVATEAELVAAARALQTAARPPAASPPA